MSHFMLGSHYTILIGGPADGLRMPVPMHDGKPCEYWQVDVPNEDSHTLTRAVYFAEYLREDNYEFVVYVYRGNGRGSLIAALLSGYRGKTA